MFGLLALYANTTSLKTLALIDVRFAKRINSIEWLRCAAHKRMKFLDKELRLVKEVSKINDSLVAVDPKEGKQLR
jgi:hypothetical protein